MADSSVGPILTTPADLPPVHSPRAPKRKKAAKRFPLFIHQSGGGRWCKKVRKPEGGQRFVYFGKVADDPKGVKALALWLEQRDDLLAGRTPGGNPADALKLKPLANRFLATKERQRDSGELSPLTWNDYLRTCERMLEAFGEDRLVSDLLPEDFEKLRHKLAKVLGPVALGNEVQRCRTLFKYAYEDGLLAHPMRFGQAFKGPSKKTLRLARAKRGVRMFEQPQAKALLDAAGIPLKAMIMLGLNCGFGNQDAASLPLAALDLEGGWVRYPRPKTGIDRRCRLWPETVTALREAIAKRPKPDDKSLAGRVFVTKYGGSWVKQGDNSPISKEFRKAEKAAGIAKPLGFYALRHTFRTVADECRDQVAVNAIMGHVDESMAAVYRERISDERLEAVAAHVRGWLFTAEPKVSTGQAAKPAAKKPSPARVKR